MKIRLASGGRPLCSIRLKKKTLKELKQEARASNLTLEELIAESIRKLAGMSK